VYHRNDGRNRIKRTRKRVTDENISFGCQAIRRRTNQINFVAPTSSSHMESAASVGQHFEIYDAAETAAGKLAVRRNGSASDRITLPNPAKSRDCGPSDKARSGQG
jgi:hypothetical protein